jgi:GABA(A) receptor-associated protein
MRRREEVKATIYCLKIILSFFLLVKYYMSELSMFKQNLAFKNRFKESSRLLGKYPERVPIIIERSENSIHLTLIDKNKYLVPKDITMSQLLWVIRKRMNIGKYQAIFLLSESGTLFASKELISSVYENNKDLDGFLYLKYANENTFG